MSQNILINAFSTLRTEISDKKSNIELVVDFRPDHFRRVLSFVGLTPRDIEMTSVWNEVFASRDHTEQSVVIRKQAPARITWTGAAIRLNDVSLKQRELSVQIQALEAQAIEIASEVSDCQKALLAGPNLAETMRLEAATSRKETCSARLGRAKQELGFTTEIMAHMIDGKASSPVVTPGHSAVRLLYYSKKPVTQQALDYLVHAAWKTGKPFSRLTLLAPPESIELLEDGKGYKALPMTSDAVNLLALCQKKTGELAPKVGASNWPAPAIAAYAWYCVIRTYNHVWGARGIVELPDRKLVKNDKRFALRAAKAGAKGEKAPKAPITAPTQGGNLADMAKSLGDIMEAKFAELAKRMTAPPADRTPSPIEKRASAAYRSALRMVASKNPIEPALQRDAIWIVSAASDLMSMFERQSLGSAMDDWQDYLDDLEGAKDKGREADDSLAPRVGEYQTYQVEEIADREVFNASFTEADVRLRSTPTAPAEPEQETLQSARRGDLDGFFEADAIEHRNCLPEGPFCSSLCPVRIAAETQPFDAEAALAELNSRQGVDPESEDPLYNGDDWEYPEEPSACPDNMQEVLYVNGVRFHRVNPFAIGMGVVSSSDSDFLAPEGTAFLSLVRADGVYVSIDALVELPPATKDGQNPLLSDERLRYKPRPKAACEDLLRQHGMSSEEIGERMSHDAFAKALVVPLREGARPAVSESAPAAPSAPTAPAKKTPPKVPPKPKELQVQVVKTTTQGEPKAKAPKAEGKTKRGGKNQPGKESSPIVNYDLKAEHKSQGDSPNTSESRIDDLKKDEWIAAHVPPHPAKSADTQSEECQCEGYPCAHTKLSIRNKIRSGGDLAWALAWKMAAGKATEAPKGKSDPIEKGDPIRVKGLPRTKALSAESRSSLRKHFGLPAEVPDEEWAAMSKDERADIRSKGSVPHWATALVLRDEQNLAKILAGKIDKEKGIELLKKPVPKQEASCSLEWTKLKARFSGVSLLIAPKSGKEKAFKKAFEDLSKRFPKNPCLPKPRKAGGSGGGESGNDTASEKKKGDTPKSSSSEPTMGDMMKLMMMNMMSKFA